MSTSKKNNGRKMRAKPSFRTKNRQITNLAAQSTPQTGADVQSVNSYLRAVLDPMGSTSAQIPDESLFPSAPYQYSRVQTLTLVKPSSLGSAGFTAAFLGSGAYTYLTDSAMINTTTGAIDWSAGTSYNCGKNSVFYWERPVTVAMSISLDGASEASRTRGRILVIPIHPQTLSTLPAAPSNWPTNISDGMDTVWIGQGGRSFSLTPGTEVQLSGTPLDTRAYDYEASHLERDTDALTGYLVVGYGFDVDDYIQLKVSFKSEIVPVGGVSASTPVSRPPVKPGVVSEVLGGLSAIADAGWTAVKGQLNTIAPAALSFMTNSAATTTANLLRSAASGLFTLQSGSFKQGAIPMYRGLDTDFVFDPVGSREMKVLRFLASTQRGRPLPVIRREMEELKQCSLPPDPVCEGDEESGFVYYPRRDEDTHSVSSRVATPARMGLFRS